MKLSSIVQPIHCVLHIPLEDAYERLKKRLWPITDEVEGNLHFATKAEGLGIGLLDQIAMFHEQHPDLALVVIDTLQDDQGSR